MRTSLFLMSAHPSRSHMILATLRLLSLRKAVRQEALSIRVQVVCSHRYPSFPSFHGLILTSAVTVSASPNITDASASVSVTGHLIPQVDIGLSAFGKIVSSTVFLNLDASTDLSVTANNGDAQACVDASTELAVNIGAEDTFFGLFDASTSKTLFKKDFPLLQVRNARNHAASSCIPWLTRFMAARNALGCIICAGITLDAMMMTLIRPTRAGPTLGARVSYARWH